MLLDYSGKNRTLSAPDNYPLYQLGTLNGKATVHWDGTAKPLKNSDTFQVLCGFMVVKVNEAAFSNYAGILTDTTYFPILVGDNGTTEFYDNLQSAYFYEFRSNDRIYPAAAAPAPMSVWRIIFFRYQMPVTLTGVQIGQDRTFTDRKAKMNVAKLALYSRNFCESEIRANLEILAAAYNLSLADVFPFFVENDSLFRHVQSANLDFPSSGGMIAETLEKRRFEGDLKFASRRKTDIEKMVDYVDAHFAVAPFVFRSFAFLVPRDYYGYATSLPEYSANGKNCSFGFKETGEMFAPPDVISPGVPTGLSAELSPYFGFTITWNASSDNVAVTGYDLEIDGVVIPLGNVLTYPHATTEVGTYTYRVRSKDAAGNVSAWSAAVEATYSLSPPNSQVIFEGDSRINDSTYIISTFFSEITDDVYTVFNEGAGGDTMAGCVSDYATEVLPRFNASFDRNFLLISAGGNDIRYGATAQDVIDLTVEYALRAASDGFEAIVATIPLGRGAAAPFNPTAVEYNDWLSANWKSTGAIALADFAAVINPAELIDDLHYTEAQTYAVAEVMKDVVESALSVASQDNLIVIEHDYRIDGVAAQLDALVTYPVFGVGVDSSITVTLAEMISEIAAQVAPHFDGDSDNNYCLIHGGSIDILYGATAAQAYDRMAEYCDDVAALGFKPIMTTIVPLASSNPYAAAMNPLAVTFNELVRANWQSSDAVGLADIASHPDIDPEVQASGTFLTSTQTPIAARLVRAVVVQDNLN